MTVRNRDRVVLLYAGARTMNPTIPSLIEAFRALESSDFRCIDVSIQEPDSVRRSIDGSDLVVIESYVVMGRDSGDGLPTCVQFDRAATAENFRSVLSHAFGSGRKLAFLAGNYDLHSPLGHSPRGPGLSDAEIARFDVLIWPYIEAPKSKESIRRTPYHEQWMGSLIDPLSNWRKISRLVDVQVEYTHSLSPTDFVDRSVLPFWNACVPGISYATRRIARESAREAGCSLAPYRQIDQVICAATSARPGRRISRGVDRLRMASRRLAMRTSIRRSSSAFVCGGGYGYLVRKYLEVPALKVPMVGVPSAQLERLGFIEGEHFLASMPEEYGDKALQIASDGALAQRLVARAAELVRTRHSAAVRADALVRAFKLAAQGRLAGARYRAGQLVCET